VRVVEVEVILSGIEQQRANRCLSLLKKRYLCLSNIGKYIAGIPENMSKFWHFFCSTCNNKGKIEEKTKELLTMVQKVEDKRNKDVASWRPLSMNPARWQREIDRISEELFGIKRPPWWPSIWPRDTDREVIAMAVDVYEQKDDIVVKAELPGVRKNNIELKISDSELTIECEKEKEEQVEEDAYYQCERSYGAFIRTLQLPTEVEANKITAAFKNGVLEIRLRKSPTAKSKEIKGKIS
jgi:HSP20 family protein